MLNEIFPQNQHPGKPGMANQSRFRRGNVVSEDINPMIYFSQFSVNWTAEEHAILQDGLARYVLDTNVIRYAKIANQLPNKTIRDVAMHCKWMTMMMMMRNAA